MSRSCSPGIRLLLHVAQTRNPELRGVGSFACDHTVSGRLEPRPLCVQMAQEENAREARTPTLTAEGEGLSLGDADSAGTSRTWPEPPGRKQGSSSSSSLAVRRPLSVHGVRTCRRSPDGQLEASFPTVRQVGTPLSPQVKRSHFSRRHLRTIPFTLGLTQAPKEAIRMGTEAPGGHVPLPSLQELIRSRAGSTDLPTLGQPVCQVLRAQSF